jgi:hypothetical protein
MPIHPSGPMLLSGGLALGSLLLAPGADAQSAAPAPGSAAVLTDDNAVMLTIFLKHDQSRPLSELNAQLERQGFYKAFPPPGIEVVSWYVMMGNRPGRDHQAARLAPAGS